MPRGSYTRYIGATGRTWLVPELQADPGPYVDAGKDTTGIQIDGVYYWLSNYSAAYEDTLVPMLRDRAGEEHLCQDTAHTYAECPACRIGAPGGNRNSGNILASPRPFAVV